MEDGGGSGAEPIIARVTESRNGQRRVTIPHQAIGLRAGDWVEIRKVEFRWPGVAEMSDGGEPVAEDFSACDFRSVVQVKGGGAV